MNEKYIFIDIDGTLLSHTIGIPNSAIQALHQAKENGHHVFICTGRTKSAVDDIILSMPFDGAIFACGGHVEIKGETIFEIAINPQEFKDITDRFNRYPVGFIAEGSRYSYYNKKGVEFFQKRDKKRLESLPPEVTRHLITENMVIPLENYRPEDSTINKFSVFADSRKDLLTLQEDFVGTPYRFITYDTGAELVPDHISKYTGIKKAMDYLQASMDQTIAIGDSMNDYEMIQGAKVGIAMGNSIQDLKDAADFVTFDVEDHGLYHAFKTYQLVD